MLLLQHFTAILVLGDLEQFRKSVNILRRDGQKIAA